MNIAPCDKNGNTVVIGTKSKLLSLSKSLLEKLPEDEAEELKSMIGKKFEVYEIDEWGGVWFSKKLMDLRQTMLVAII